MLSFLIAIWGEKICSKVKRTCFVAIDNIRVLEKSRNLNQEECSVLEKSRNMNQEESSVLEKSQNLNQEAQGHISSFELVCRVALSLMS